MVLQTSPVEIEGDSPGSAVDPFDAGAVRATDIEDQRVPL